MRGLVALQAHSPSRALVRSPLYTNACNENHMVPPCETKVGARRRASNGQSTMVGSHLRRGGEKNGAGR